MFSMELKTPQVTNTSMQTAVNARFFQRELGIIAGRPSLSWRPHQKMNTGMSTIDMMRIASVSAFLVLDASAARTLQMGQFAHTQKRKRLTQRHRTSLPM